MNVIYPILPTTLLIVLGVFLKNKFKLDKEFWSGLEKVVYWIFFPILLLESTVNATLGKEFIPLALLALLIMLIGILYSLIGIFLFKIPTKTRSSIFQCGFRFNTYVGISIVAVALGPSAVTYFIIVTGVCVPLANYAAISALAINSGHSAIREVIRNPLIIATLLGLGLNFLGFSFPEFINNTLKLISTTTIVLGMITVGAALQFESFGYYRRLSLYFLCIKLLLLPLTTMFILQFVNIMPELKTVLVIFSALPTASSAYILSMRMNGDGKTVALQITIGSTLAMATIPLILYLHYL